MKPRKIPMRTCVVTREKCEKKELIRIVRTPEQTVEIDLTGKKNGKGAYIKLTKETIELEKKKKALNKALEIEIPNSIYEELEKLINT